MPVRSVSATSQLRAQTDAALRSVRKRRIRRTAAPDCCAGTACVRMPWISQAACTGSSKPVPAAAAPQDASLRRTWTIIGVADVARSFAWYQTLLGLPKSAPEHDDFGQILDADGTVLLCLHQWGSHGHPPLTRPDPPPGNGLLLFFRVDDFDEALPRARALVSRLEEEPHRNPSTATMEFALRDPDGYYVMVSALSA
jgi:catechol 2,3-dioxygenase-like lactoylglutathione lyase family enzyme